MAISKRKQETIIKIFSETSSIEEAAARSSVSIEKVKDILKENGLLEVKKRGPKKVAISTLLSNEEFWEQLKQQLTDEEIIYFSDQYSKHIEQFERTAPVLHTEKMQVMHLVRSEILLNRCLVRQKDYHIKIEEKKIEIDRLAKENPVKNAAEIRSLEQLINTFNASFSSFNDEAKVLMDKISGLRKELKATREQRTKNMKDANTNFSAFILALEEETLREREGIKMNIFRAAMEKERARLLNYHKYMDGDIDFPIMSPEYVDIREYPDE
jgi:hypothetical protein